MKKNPKTKFAKTKVTLGKGAPFSRCIKVANLRSGRKTNFTIKLNEQEKSDLASYLDVVNILVFNCSIDLKPFEGGWLVVGKIKLVASQFCVVTLDKIRTDLRIPLKRFLVLGHDKYPPSDFSPLDLNLVDADPLTELVELGDIISEELILMLPRYPRKKGVILKKNDHAFFESDEESNPFQKLANLRKDLTSSLPPKSRK